MTTLGEMVPLGHVLRACASYEMLPQDQCVVPDRCVPKRCRRCARWVHYDPSASLPFLGPEWVLCDICIEESTP